MELVFHNCDTNHPKEFENNSLIITDGKNVYPRKIILDKIPKVKYNENTD